MNHDTTPTAKPEPEVEGLAEQISDFLFNNFQLNLTAPNNRLIGEKELAERLLPILSAHQQRQDEVVEGLRAVLEKCRDAIRQLDEAANEVRIYWNENVCGNRAERIPDQMNEHYRLSCRRDDLKVEVINVVREATAILSQPLAG